MTTPRRDELGSKSFFEGNSQAMISRLSIKIIEKIIRFAYQKSKNILYLPKW